MENQYKIFFIASSGARIERTYASWYEAKSAMRNAFIGGVVRCIAYELADTCGAWSHVAEWTWDEADTLEVDA